MRLRGSHITKKPSPPQMTINKAYIPVFPVELSDSSAGWRVFSVAPGEGPVNLISFRSILRLLSCVYFLRCLPPGGSILFWRKWLDSTNSSSWKFCDSPPISAVKRLHLLHVSSLNSLWYGLPHHMHPVTEPCSPTWQSKTLSSLSCAHKFLN